MVNALSLMVSEPGFAGGAFTGRVFAPSRLVRQCRAKLFMESTGVSLPIVGSFLLTVASVVSFLFCFSFSHES